MVRRATLARREAVAALLEKRGDLLVVTGLGSPSYDVHAAGDRQENYYLWGAMGSAALVGLGLALTRPERRILVLTGDGEQLMGLGGLATIGIAAPANLTIAIVDNERFGETGMQISHSGFGLQLDRVAAACNFVRTSVCTTMADVARVRADLQAGASGPALHVLKVDAQTLPRSLPSRDAPYIKNRFRQALGLEVA